ncbi:FecR family protein [Parabacteroides distasonis]|nr:FecR family protein [Parabacteroides distasonis]
MEVLDGGICSYSVIGAFAHFFFLYNKTEYWTDSSCKLSYSSLSGKSKIILPDSSVVWLNSGSSLRYAVNFFENREVDLSGKPYLM